MTLFLVSTYLENKSFRLEIVLSKISFLFAQMLKFSISAAKSQNKSFKECSNLKSVIRCISGRNWFWSEPSRNLNFGLVRMYVTPYRIIWITCTSDLVISYADEIVGIPMGTICAPLVVDLFLFCCKKDFMTPLSDDNQADIIETFNSTSRYLDDLLNIDNSYFEGVDNQINPPELQLNKANTSETEVSYLGLHLSISNGFVSSKM